jgi:putative redox protein
LRRTHMAPALLIGHSLGGAAVLAAAEGVPEARAVVTIAAPSDPVHATHLFKDRIPELTPKVKPKSCSQAVRFGFVANLLTTFQGSV